MVGVFKKYRGVSGKVDAKSEERLGEVVRCYTGLCVMSGWVSWEDESSIGGEDGERVGRANGGGAGNGNGNGGMNGGGHGRGGGGGGYGFS